MDWVDKPQNKKGLYGILQLLRGSHLKNFPLKTLKLGRVGFHSVTFQSKLRQNIPTQVVRFRATAECNRSARAVSHFGENLLPPAVSALAVAICLNSLI